MQFAFLAFLLGHSLQAFGQWKALLHLALACEEAPLRTRSQFYADLLATVRAQLDHCLAAGRCAHAPGLPVAVLPRGPAKHIPLSG